jgi:hypothetical protein
MMLQEYADYDDNRFFVDTDALAPQMIKIAEQLYDNYNFLRNDNSNAAVIAEIKALLAKRHNAVILNNIRIGTELLYSVVAFNNRSDYLLFLLRWS